MEEIIQILIFAGAMIVSVVIQSAKNKKKAPGTLSPQEVLEDMFPDLEEFQEAPSAEEVVVPKSVVSPQRKPFKAQTKPEPPKKEVRSEPEKSEVIRLNTRKEARRAFIYSEIFNRKY